eukprot:TRINITY_DN6601_c0_g1_i2.p1 TRINITY_DN6601_c0_g1~~TRINITY_DN6601_c0_g1_i2.p1  ORF type:complete len:135 (-),score=44.73 TRINITY_DN6601_c0_g1_i2:256-660(-)
MSLGLRERYSGSIFHIAALPNAPRGGTLSGTAMLHDALAVHARLAPSLLPAELFRAYGESAASTSLEGGEETAAMAMDVGEEGEEGDSLLDESIAGHESDAEEDDGDYGIDYYDEGDEEESGKKTAEDEEGILG